MQETPSISTGNYTSNAVNVTSDWGVADPPSIARRIQGVEFLHEFHHPLLATQLQQQPEPAIDTYMSNQSQRRIVQVFIADTNENVPLDQSVLYSGEQKLTDLTDAELFFEVPIMERLTTHNAKRITFTDKEASKRAGKDIFLEPARIRDLKMVVVNVATF